MEKKIRLLIIDDTTELHNTISAEAQKKTYITEITRSSTQILRLSF